MGMKPRINYWAILVAALAYFFLGGIWFTLLTEQWLRGLGTTKEEIMARAGSSSSPVPYITSFVCNLLIAYVLWWVINATGRSTAARGVQIGVLMWLGFIATILLTEYAFEARPHSLFAINAGYPLIGMIVMGAILGAWPGKVAAQ
jgi:hypothetical protein